MSKHTSLTLCPPEREHLETLVRTGQHKARALTRLRCVLLLDRSQEKRYTDAQIAEVLGCHPLTVANARRRFLTGGLEAVLAEKPMGPQAPAKMTGEVEAHLTVLACSSPPTGQSRWTVRLLASRLVELGYVEELSHVTVSRTLKKMHSSRGG